MKDATPLVDFAVWGPCSNRMEKRQVFQGMVMSAGGVCHSAELRGPSSFADWKACFLFFCTAAIMLKLLTPAAADAHLRHITYLSTLHGESVWLMLYQVDIRCRSEHAERVRRRVDQGGNNLPQGVRLEYDPAKLWEYVYISRVG